MYVVSNIYDSVVLHHLSPPFVLHLCRFKKLCEDAFLKLRENGTLFLNLFTMMMSCGIPELQNRDDISYIRCVCVCCASSGYDTIIIAEYFCGRKLSQISWIY